MSARQPRVGALRVRVHQTPEQTEEMAPIWALEDKVGMLGWCRGVLPRRKCGAEQMYWGGE